jgi:hypothetical protein
MENALSDLERLRSTPVPRDAELCQALAARFEPASRFFIYRVLWLGLGGLFSFVPALIAVTIVTGLTRGFYRPPGPAAPWLLPVLFTVWALALVASWFPFSSWLRRRKAEVLALFRDGKLGAATATGHFTMASKAGVVHRVSFSFDDGERLRAFSVTAGKDQFPKGATTPVLSVPQVRRCAIFVGPKQSLLALRTR